MNSNLIIGCSHVEGFELEEEIGIDIYNHTNAEYNKSEIYRKDKRFSDILFKKLKTDYYALYMTGCSNSWIVQETIKQVNVNPNLKNVIICWTGITRLEKVYKHNPVFINPLYPKHTPHHSLVNSSDVKLLEQWEQAENKLFLDLNFYQNLTYHYAHYLKLFLESKDINFFFLESITTGVDFSKLTPNCLNVSMKDYCEKGNFKKGKGGHFLSEGHKAWAEYLYKNLKKRIL